MPKHLTIGQGAKILKLKKSRGGQPPPPLKASRVKYGVQGSKTKRETNMGPNKDEKEDEGESEGKG